MKTSLFSATAIALALAAGSAAAADLPSKKGAPVYAIPAPVFTWTGIYAGLNIGGGWVDPSNVSGVVGGGQIGYNYQFATAPIVVGLEADFQGTSIARRGVFGAETSLPWFGTVRGRAGLTLLDNRLLVYGTGGFAYGEVKYGWGGARNDTLTGWTAGGGVEYAFLPDWLAKIEYLYSDISKDYAGSWNPITGIYTVGHERHTKINTVRAGVNYHFNLFAPAPVVAKY